MLALSAIQANTCAAASQSALARARELAKALPDRRNSSATSGEVEMAWWWVDHDALFQEAREEWGRRHEALYQLEANEERFIRVELREAIAAVEAAALRDATVDESAVRRLLRQTEAPGVWAVPIFTPAFCEMVIQEVQHYEASGIPLRRPNGMNRYGAILDQLGLEDSMAYLSRRYLRPLGQLLYPYLISTGDADEHYAFMVRYKLGEDTQLAEHADASVLTLNANLGLPASQGGFKGGRLAFRGTRFIDEAPQKMAAAHVSFDAMEPGEGLLHLGGHYHAALPIESGERVNLIVWLHGKYEVVRVAPYKQEEQLSAKERWTAFSRERAEERLQQARSQLG